MAGMREPTILSKHRRQWHRNDVTGNDFIRRLRRLARRLGDHFAWLPARGKGSHGIIEFGRRATTLPDPKRELKTPTLMSILKQLGLGRQDLG